MGFVPDDVDTLVALVRHHLLLPSIATSRDLDDPAAIEAVAETIGSVELLDLLHALTEADSLATGDTAWTPWKAKLVASLVDRVRAALGGDRVPERPPAPEGDRELVARAAGTMLVEGSGHVAGHRRARPACACSAASWGSSACTARTCAPRVARSTDDGVAISEFDIEPTFGEPPDWERFESDLRNALRGRVAIGRAPRRARHALRASAPSERGRAARDARDLRQRRVARRDLRRGAHR